MQREDQQREGPEPVHCLLLDREARKLYICRRDETVLLLSLLEPNEKDASRVFIDGLRMSPGNENYLRPLFTELALQPLASLDKQLGAIPIPNRVVT